MPNSKVTIDKIRVLRAHLKKDGIYFDEELTIPRDLRQYYSKLPGYKAKCNDCGQTVSFLNKYVHLRIHLRRHYKRIQSGDETFKMAWRKKCRKKRSKLWDYFEELKPSLAKCTKCKKEIHIRNRTSVYGIFRRHLNKHGIFPDNDTHTLPDDLRQYYSELPGYKAKCNDCGKATSFASTITNLHMHLRIHSKSIQSQDETFKMARRKKRSKLWDYFKELKPSLAKCTKCKKEIHIRYPTRAYGIFRAHLSGHGIFPENDSHRLPDDLRQYYSELPGYEAKCNDCGKAMSFVANMTNLQFHLTKHSTKIQSGDGTFKMARRKKRSKLWDYFVELKPSLAKCTKCKEKIHIRDPTSVYRIFRAHLCGHGIFPDNDTHTLPDDLRQYFSELPGYKAKCNDCGKAISFVLTYTDLRVHLRKHSKRIQSGDKTSKMARGKKRSKLWDYFEELKPSLAKCTKCKKEIYIRNPKNLTIFRKHLSGHGIFPDNNTHKLPDDLRQYYSKLPGYKAKCNDCDKAISFATTITNLRKHLRRHSKSIPSQDETVIMVPKRKRSKVWDYFNQLEPLLVKCRKCTKEIRMPNSRVTIDKIRVLRAHLKKDGIYFDEELTIPRDLRQYYSKLPGYKAKCNDCGQTVSFLSKYVHLRIHLRRHYKRIQCGNGTFKMTRRKKRWKKRSKLWNYFEELKPLLAKCTKCKKEIHTRDPTSAYRIFRAHLSGHGIFVDNDTYTLPDDLRQYYSELPGYKAKCNDCGKAISFVANMTNLRFHLTTHFTRIQNGDGKHLRSGHIIFPDNDTHTLPDDLRQYYSELPGYKAKCNDCGETLSFLHNNIKLRQHLNRHSKRIQSGAGKKKIKSKSIWDKYDVTDSNDATRTCKICKKVLKANYNNLMGHWRYFHSDTKSNRERTSSIRNKYDITAGNRATCIECKTVIKAKYKNLWMHSRHHSDTGTFKMAWRKKRRKKRSKLWDYFEELKPSLAKCTKCKEEIHIRDPSRVYRIFRAHLSGHGIFPDNDTHTLPDDLRQYYSELLGYKAKCNDCDKAISFATTISNLRKHLRTHSKRIRSQDEPSTSSSTGYDMDPNAECQSLQERVDLILQSYAEQLRKEQRAHNGPSTSSPENYVMDPYAERQCQEPPGLFVQSFELTTKGTGALDSDWLYYTIPSTSSSVDYLMERSAELQCQEPPDWFVQLFELTTEGTGAFHSNWFYYTIPSTSSSTGYDMDPNAERQSQKTADLALQSYEQTSTLDGPSTSNLAEYIMDSSAERQSQEPVDLSLQSFEQTRKGISTLYESSTSSPKCYIMDPSTKKHIILLQSQEPPDKLVQSFELTTGETGALDSETFYYTILNTSNLADHIIDSSKEKHITLLQSQEPPGVPVQSFQLTTGGTGALDSETFHYTIFNTLSSTDYNMDSNAERQSQEPIDLALQTFEQTRKGISTLDESSISNPKCYIMDRSTEKRITLLQSQELPGVSVQSFQLMTERIDALNSETFYYTILSTSSSTGYDMDPNTGRQSQEPVDLSLQPFEQSRKETSVFDEPSTSNLAEYFMDPSAERQSQEPVDLSLQSYEQTRKGTSTLDGPSTSNSTDYIMDLSAERQSQEPVDLSFHSFEQMRRETSALDEPSTSNTADYIIPSAERQSQEPVALSLHTFEQMRREKSSRDEPSTLNLADYVMDPSAERQSQEPIDLALQSFQQTRKETNALDKPSTSTSTCCVMDSSTGKHIPLLQSQEPPRVPLKSFEPTTEGTGVLDPDWFYYTIPSTSSSANYVMDPSAERQCREPPGLFVQSFELTTEGTGTLDTDWLYYTIPSTSSSADYVMDAFAERQCQEPPSLFVQSFELTSEGTGAFYSNWFYYTIPSTSSLTGYDMDPNAERQSQETAHLALQSYEQTSTLNGPSTSNSAEYFMDPSAERQSQEPVDLSLQSYEQTRKGTSTLEPSTLNSAEYIMDSSAERQSQGQEPIDLTLQLFEQLRKETSALDESSTSSPNKCYIMDPSTGKHIPLLQSQESPGFPGQLFEQTTQEAGALDSETFYYTILNTSNSADYIVDNSKGKHITLLQSQEPPSVPVQSFQLTTKGTGALDSETFHYTILNTSSSTCYDMDPNAER